MIELKRLKWIASGILAGCVVVMSLQPLPLLAGPGYTPVRDVDSAVLNPFAREVGWFENNTANAGSFTVPAGKSLQITGVSGLAYTPGCTNVFVTIQATVGGTIVTHRLSLMVKDTTTGNGYFMMPYTNVDLFADPNTTVNIVVRRDVQPAPSVGWYCDIVLTGRLVSQ